MEPDLQVCLSSRLCIWFGSMPRQLLARQGLGREASVLVDNPAEKSVANDGSARRK